MGWSFLTNLGAADLAQATNELEPFQLYPKSALRLGLFRDAPSLVPGGWKRWSREWLYGTLGLFSGYRVTYGQSISAVAPA